MRRKQTSLQESPARHTIAQPDSSAATDSFCRAPRKEHPVNGRSIAQQHSDGQAHAAEPQFEGNLNANQTAQFNHTPTMQAAHANNCSAQQQWASGRESATSTKTKKQLIGLTCALSLVCGILGGVIGDGLSTALDGSSQTGGMQQNSMQRPGGQGGSGSGTNAPGTSGNNGSADPSNGTAPSAPDDATAPNDTTGQSNSNSSDATPSTNGSNSTSSSTTATGSNANLSSI